LSFLNPLLGWPNDVAGANLSPCSTFEKDVEDCVNAIDMQLYYQSIMSVVGSVQPPARDAIALSFRDDLPSLCNINTPPFLTTKHRIRWIQYGIPVFQE